MFSAAAATGVPWARGPGPLRVALGVALAWLIGGGVACGADDAASITDRLWVSDVPSNPKEEIFAFAIANLRGRKLGAFYQGSIYQGTQRAFRLELEGRRAVFEMLQDGSRYPVTIRSCKPTTGFHFCVELEGDPLVGRRYQSRKRWSLGRSKEGGPESEVFPAIPSLLEKFGFTAAEAAALTR